jgi:hypothetical protein
MRKLLGFLIIGLVLLQGCVEFERQTIVWRHDVDRDELRMVMIYEGIQAGNEVDAEELGELRSVLLRPRTFFFSNWIFEYDRDVWLEMRDDVRANRDEVSPEFYAAVMRLNELVLDNVRVDNGDFYLNDANKLAGYQRVTFSNVSAIVAAANALMNTALLDEELDASDIAYGSASEGMVLDAAYAGHEWITLYEGELRLRLPTARTDYEELRLELADDDYWLAYTEAGMRWTYVNGVQELVFGEPWASRNSMSVAVDDSPYQPNLLDFVEEEGLLETHPDFDAIERRFLDREASR